MRYTIENADLRLTVDTHGAEAVSVINKHTGAEMLWQADPEVWNRHAPILFPYTGKLTDGKMLAKGATSRKIAVAVRRTYVKSSIIKALTQTILDNVKKS